MKTPRYEIAPHVRDLLACIDAEVLRQIESQLDQDQAILAYARLRAFISAQGHTLKTADLMDLMGAPFRVRIAPAPQSKTPAQPGDAIADSADPRPAWGMPTGKPAPAFEDISDPEGYECRHAMGLRSGRLVTERDSGSGVLIDFMGHGVRSGFSLQISEARELARHLVFLADAAGASA